MKKLKPAVALWVVGGAACVLLLGAYFVGNVFVSVGAAVLVLVLAAVLAGTQGDQTERLAAGLRRLQEHRREFLFDEVDSWRGRGDLADLVADVVAYNLHRREFYRGAVEAVGTPFMLCNLEGVVTHASTAMLSMLKKGKADVVGRSVGEAFYGRKNDSLAEHAMAAGNDFSKELSLKLWDGRGAEVMGVVNCIRGSGRKVIGAVICLTDLAELKRHQAELSAQAAHLADVGNSINDLAQRVASAAEELSASADEQAKGAERQKAQTESVSTAMEEMTSTVLEVAKNASQSSEAATTATKTAKDGVGLVGESVKGINGVADSSHTLSKVLGQLNDQAGEIGRIINVINDIADQTNLLALNAAIEAARAGDAGRGFAVVADEVRKLAEKTMSATKEVEHSIHEIQERSKNAVTTMAATEKQVEASTDLSTRTGKALEDILARIDDVTGRAAQIATAAEEQSSAAEEINKSIGSIADIAKESEEGAGQAASATRELAELAQKLLQMSMSFSTRKSDASKLRGSAGQMKGILPKLMFEYVRTKYDAGVFKKVSADLGDPVFMAGRSYSDKVLQQMAESLSRASGKDVRTIFLELGQYTIGEFYKVYRPYFHTKDLKEFYLTMNETHAEITKSNPGITPPHFTYEDRGNKLTMIYKSSRGYHDYFEGILRGAAEFFKTPVDIRVEVQDPETARAEITFR